MKIFLDDVRDAPDETWRVCRTYLDFIRLIDSCVAYGTRIDAISFDHDLGYTGSVGYKMNGYKAVCLVEFLIHTGKLEVGELYCHSANPSGRAKIEAAIRSIERFKNGK